ncbi:hypothetical protein E05_46540 [Plautia stali symbiont]|nr:hypothetical protein E05_46540 [Plautia stali symbiont]
MLLLAMTISTLLQYHRVLALGFSQQWQQRQAWQVAGQALLGRDTAGWHIVHQPQSLPSGCVLDPRYRHRTPSAHGVAGAAQLPRR